MLAVKLLLRNWRSGELKLMMVALILAVTVVSGISIFVERLEASMHSQTADLLGADSVLIGPRLKSKAWEVEANKLKILHSNFVRLRSMVYAGDEGSLTSLHFIEQNYPLRGQIRLSDELVELNKLEDKANKQFIAQGAPNAGEVWAAADFFYLLNIKLGAEIEIGKKKFIVSKVLVDSPESFSRFPIVIVNQQDLVATGLIMPGSNINYRWLLASDDKEKLLNFKIWLKPKLNAHQEISDAHSRNGWLRDTLENSSNLLSFAAVISVLLAGAAISISSRQFVERHIVQVALIKSIGASSNKIRKLYFGQLLLLGAVASVIGLVLGHVLQQMIAGYIVNFYQINLGSGSIVTYFNSLLSGLVFLLFFAFPPLWHLPEVPPIKILRKDIPVNRVRSVTQVSISAIAVFLLIFLFSGNIELTLKVSVAMIIIALLTVFFARLTLLFSKKLAVRTRGAWRLGLVNLQRRYQHNSLLIAVFSITLMAFVSLSLIRTSYWQDIQNNADQNELNYFIYNIEEQDKTDIEKYLAELTIEHEPMTPTIFGRMTQINNQKPTKKQADYYVFSRDFWLTWFDTLPESQPLIAGVWWHELNGAVKENWINVSVREDIAEELHLKIGDMLEFSIGGELQLTKITSIRKSNFDRGLNFNFVFQPGAISQYHHIYNLGIQVPPEHKRAILQFGKRHPTITIDSLDAWLVKTKRILEQALDGIFVVLLLTLFCGCLVLLAAVNSSMITRQKESGLLRAFGSSKQLILGSVWLEFTAVGFISGLVAVIASEVLVFQVQQMMSDIPFQLHLHYWIIVPIISMLFIGLLGVLACKSTISATPLVVLRDAT